MNPEAYRLLDLMKQLAPDQNVSPSEHNIVHIYQTRYMAKLMVVLAEEQEKASEKIDGQVALDMALAIWIRQPVEQPVGVLAEWL